MKKMHCFIAAACVSAAVLLTTGCATPTTELTPEAGQIVAGFAERDINASVKTAVDSIISQDRIKILPGANRAVVVIKNIINDTTSRGRDAEALAEALGLSLRESLTNSGKIVVYNPAAAQYATQRIDPQYALTGRLTQRFLRQDNGDVQIEYNLNLQLIDLATGLEFWQKRIPIRKLADRRNAL